MIDGTLCSIGGVYDNQELLVNSQYGKFNYMTTLILKGLLLKREMKENFRLSIAPSYNILCLCFV